jgi:hypothetical protein
MSLIVALFVALVVVLAQDIADEYHLGPRPCSSPYYHKRGKCGGKEHGYLRCPTFMWCNRRGL